MEYNMYFIIGITKSKIKYANIYIKADTIKATNLEGAINKFKKKYPKFLVFSVQRENNIWFNKNIREEYKEKYGGKV